MSTKGQTAQQPEPHVGASPSNTAVPADSVPEASKDRLLEVRTLRRKERSDARRSQAEAHMKTGSAHSSAGKYQKAIEEFQAAIKTHGPRPAYLSQLAAAWLKLEEWDSAEHCAQRALEHDPTFVEARYQRGLARKGNLQLVAAGVDFRAVLTQDPDFTKAKAALLEIRELLRARGEGNALFDREQAGRDAAPPVDGDAIELESLSDSSDCQHTGNGVPCRFYNHDGCARGARCAFSHAPDHKSVRDELGRNVCLFFLFGTCKFGATKCVYAHETSYLRRGGWWDDAEKRELYRDCIGGTVAWKEELKAPMNATFTISAFERTRIWNWPELAALEEELMAWGRGKERVDYSLIPFSAFGSGDSLGGRSRGSGSRGSRGRDRGRGRGGQRKQTERRRYRDDSYWDSDEFEERSLNYGYTFDELNEALSQGIKPWDE